MGKVSGIDAVMIYARDPAALSSWYATSLGIETRFEDADGNYYGDVVDTANGRVVHFGIYPRQSADDATRGSLMVNYRVDDLDHLLGELRSQGVSIKRVVDESQGRFAYLDDPEGNPIELWTRRS